MTNQSIFKIALADDRLANRQTICENLLRSGRVELTLVAENGLDFLEKMSHLEGSPRFPQAVLMDIEMPEMDGIEAVRAAKSRWPQVEFLMLTVFDDDEKIFQAIRAGAVGYLLKDEPTENILAAVREAVEMGGAPMSPVIARKALRLLTASVSSEKTAKKAGLLTESGLSTRETDVLKLVVEGLDYRQIGERLFISPHTARTHIGAVYRKLHISSKAEAIHLAHRKGWFG